MVPLAAFSFFSPNLHCPDKTVLSVGLSFNYKILQRKQEDEYTANARWAVFCTSFSCAVAGVVVLMHVVSSLSHYIIGTKVEGVLTVVLLAFWSTTVAIGTCPMSFSAITCLSSLKSSCRFHHTFRSLELALFFGLQ